MKQKSSSIHAPIRATTRNVVPLAAKASTRSTHVGHASFLSRILSRTIVIKFVAGISGGPEALVQLALAVHDAHGVHLGCLGKPNPFYAAEYPDLWNSMPNCSMAVENLSPDDLVVVPEVTQCEPIGKVRAPNIWLLGSSNIGPDECPRLSHNHYLAHLASMRADSILYPYITPSIVTHAVQNAGLLPDGSFQNLPDLASQKERIVLLDDDAVMDFHGVSQQLKNANINVIVVTGYSRDDLLQLQLKAKVVVDLCMRGTERMPIESSLHGVVLFTNACQSGEDKEDYPVSERHRTISFEGILKAIDNYAEEVMDPGQVKLRRLYGFEINRESMARDVERWASLG